MRKLRPRDVKYLLKVTQPVSGNSGIWTQVCLILKSMAGLREELSPVKVTEWLVISWSVCFQNPFFLLFSPLPSWRKQSFILVKYWHSAWYVVETEYVCLRAKNGRSWLVISIYPACFAAENRKEMANILRLFIPFIFMYLSFLFFVLYNKNLKVYVAARPHKENVQNDQNKKKINYWNTREEIAGDGKRIDWYIPGSVGI